MSFEARLRYDGLVRAFMLEIAVILWGASVALLILQQHSLIILVVMSLAATASLYLLWRELTRRRRKLGIGTVVKSRARQQRSFRVSFPAFQIWFSDFEVEVAVDGGGVIWYVDTNPLKAGDRVLLLFDQKKRVLASRPLVRLVSIDLVRKLV